MARPKPKVRMPARKSVARTRAPTVRLGRELTLPDRKYAQLLMDPCAAELAHSPSLGSSESGYLIRLYRRYVLHSVGATNNGMFVWYPGYHLNNSIGGFNTFTFEDSSITTVPTNTAAQPLGSGLGSSGSAQVDCSNAWVSGSNVAEARTIAACAKVYFTGSIVNNAGSLAIIPNLSIHNLVQGGSLGGVPTIGDIISLSPKIGRVPLEDKEIRWCPSHPDLVYRSTQRPADILFTGAVAASATTLGSAAMGSEGIALAWSGLNTTSTNDLIIECYKVVEWKPDAVGITGITNTVKPTSSLDTILSWIDSVYPGWKTDSVNVVNDYVSSMAKMVLGGVGLNSTSR